MRADLLTEVERQRYARHLALPGFDRAAQERLRDGRVLVIGAGGLGCPALLYLVAAGVGRITIVDPDRIDVSNLQRQVLYRESESVSIILNRHAWRYVCAAHQK